MLNVLLKPKGKVAKLPQSVELVDSATATDLTDVIVAATGLSKHRVRLSVKTDPDANKSKAKDYVLRPNDQLTVFSAGAADVTVFMRDLGPQIPWRTVFLLEYVGPIIIHPLFFFGQRYIYGSTNDHTLVQKIIFGACMLHFIKRELETAFLHKFSLATMPMLNLFKNCGHYWLLSGVLLGYFVYAPPSWEAKRPLIFGSNLFGWDPAAVWLLATIWLIAEVSNFVVHANLASLRPTGSTERRIPYGYGFNWVSCPNYLFEAESWLVLSLTSGNWSMFLFFVVSTVQMYVWAVKKHRRYLREFPDYPKNRKAMIPFLA